MARQSDRPCVYIVQWPDGVFKIGFTETGRYRGFLRRGGQLVSLINFDNVTQALAHEAQAHAAARTMRERAFKDRTQAVAYLGGTGCGWVECYRKEPEPNG